MSIDEIQTNIEELNQTNTSLDTRLEELQNSDVIRWFFRKNLTQEELDNLGEIISSYLENRKQTQADDINAIIILKKALYKNMTPYIDINQMESYLWYIQDDASIIKEQDNVIKEISKNKELLDSKVDFIETKIQDHKISFSESLYQLIGERIDNKLALLREWSKFSTLSAESKVSVLNKTIRKIKIRIANTQQIEDRTDVLETRLNLYYIILERIEEFKSEIE